MGPKTRRVARSFESTSTTARESKPKSKSSKLRSSKHHQSTSTTALSGDSSKSPKSENIKYVQHQPSSSHRGSRKKSSSNVSVSSPKLKHDSTTQSPQSKKRRFDIGDSGFETESNSSVSPPILNETNLNPLIKGEELNIEFPKHHKSEDLIPTCSRLWPNLGAQRTQIFNYLSNRSQGSLLPNVKKAIADQHLVSPLADFEVLAHDKPFGSRITTIDWHPRKQNYFCATSKHGDLGFYKFDADIKGHLHALKTYAGFGPGGYISAFKFHPVDNERFFTSTLEGKVVLGNTMFGGNHVEKVLLNTGTWDFWYCSMDVSPAEDFVVAGRNNGMTAMCTTSGKLIWEQRLHAKKVTHAELSPREPHILCTASLDHSVRVWDLRMLREVKTKPLPLDELRHEKGVNSAYFSLTDGTRLLTTDQHDEIRVYQAPFWHLETTILHPHRFFRHLTPHKAAWHPLADKIVVGRYPGDASCPEFGLERTIDIFDAATGKMHCELKDQRFNGLISLCKFNNSGDAILSAMGFQINLWWKEPDDSMDDENLKNMACHKNIGDPSRPKPPKPNSSRQRKKKLEEEKVSKIKLSKLNTKK